MTADPVNDGRVRNIRLLILISITSRHLRETSIVTLCCLHDTRGLLFASISGLSMFPSEMNGD